MERDQRSASSHMNICTYEENRMKFQDLLEERVLTLETSQLPICPRVVSTLGQIPVAASLRQAAFAVPNSEVVMAKAEGRLAFM